VSGSERAAFRLDGGRIDRRRSLTFAFDGVRYPGYAGDTLASALLAQGVHLAGRSFKYHRPRGIVTAGVEEPSALVQLGTGGRSEPNARATMVELHDGLEAVSQNRWPSLQYDVGAINGLLSPLLPSGFYYKTFMWPPSWWRRVYEGSIRRAAGLGRAPTVADPDRYDHCHAHCDVLIAGAGPAGLMAALAAAASGARVILAEQDAAPGGWLLGEPASHITSAWLAETLDRLERFEELRILTRTQVAGYYDHNHLTLLERVSDHLGAAAPPHLPRQRLWHVRARQVVLATGSLERPLVFPGNDRPGVMLAGAVRTYINRYAVLPGRRAVVFTNNDSAYAAALALHHAGAEVTVVDLRPEVTGALTARARAASIRIQTGCALSGTHGQQRVSAVDIHELNRVGDGLGRMVETVPCDLVGVAGGWVPALHLHSQARGRLVWDDARAIFRPGEVQQGGRSAGACNGTFGLQECLAEGAEAGAAAARAAGFDAETPVPPQVPKPEAEIPMRPLFVVPGAGDAGKKAFVDLQNDVTAADIALALAEGYRSIEHVKRYTTTGMGTDQGKTSNMNALALVSAITGQPVPAIGVTTFRPPYTPLAFGAVVGRNCKALFDPVRRTPMHDWHEQAGAVFEDVGQWRRPRYYPRAGEDMAAAVAREVETARTDVAILDASTLGKIDIQGRDAAEFLSRIYTNAWSKLGVGRCRYGLMLGEDGMVFDDGVTSRLAEHHYLMSTTSGGAARVLAWLEEWLQTEWPELKVFCTSVTEQWATVSISGPQARRLLADLVGDAVDLAADAFPHMSVREARVLGVEARVFRISFTGELGFEIQVPACYGLGLWQAAMAAGRRHGICPYGTEAMHVLRAEKGYIITGQETDGTATPADLGMDWIVATRKPDFIGKRSLQRGDMRRDDRKHLMGLLTGEPDEVLEEGAQLVQDPAEAIPMAMVGHVTSSYWSPNLRRSFALAMVRDGRARIGQKLYVPMPDRTIQVEVTEPVFFDQTGERLRA
jgi:sarcosine oxidase subunit alpha